MDFTLFLSSLRRSIGPCLLLLVATMAPLIDANSERRLTGSTTLSSKDRVSVVLDRETSHDGTYVTLKITVPQDVKIDAFMLPDPPRIVLDLDGASVKRSETFTAPLNGVVKQVRLGSHPSKLRVVVDLNKAEAPKYDWKAGKRQVILRMLEEAAPPPSTEISAPVQDLPKKAEEVPPLVVTEEEPIKGTVANTIPDLPQKTDEPVSKISPPGGPGASLGALEDPVKPSLPAADVGQEKAPSDPGVHKETVPLETERISPPLVQEPLAGAAPAEEAGSLGAAAAAAKGGSDAQKLPVQGGIKLVGYRFEYGEPNKNPILKITLNNDGAKAQISKVDSTTYKIVVPKCSLANDDLVLPQFPPADFVGFIMVMSEEVNGSVEITISVEEGFSLTTMVRGDEIWVQQPGM